jgi:hypothetical protein
MRFPRLSRRSLGGAAALAVTAALLGAPKSVHGNAVPVFNSGMLPAAPGLGLPHNEDAEPGIAVDGGGTVWVASDIEPYAADDPRAQPTGVLSGSDVWKSSDGGKTYQWVAAPFTQIQSNQAGVGGEDTDIAAAPVKNSMGCYDIWVASLWVGSTNLAVSQDCGVSWTTVPVNGEPGQDRPWLAADGACTVYLTYHGLAPYNTDVEEFSLPPCTGNAQSSTVTPTQTNLFLGNIAPGLTNRFGKVVVDTSPTSPHQHNIYQPMQGCPTATISGLPEEGVGCSTNAQIFMGVSTAGPTQGTVWTNPVVHTTSNSTLYIWPDTAAVDSAGNVYIAWMEGPANSAHDAFLSVSKDGGMTWSAPSKINQPPSFSAAYPTVSASTPGHVEVAWYGTTRDGGSDDQSVMGLPATTGNPACGATGQPTCWQLWWGTSDDFGQTWTEGPITGTVHTGILCVEGGGCNASNGDRNLLDDLGVAIDPNTGTTAIAFDNDQPESLQGNTHTDYAYAVTAAQSQAAVPDLLRPWLAGLLGVGIAAGVVRARRRRREPA